MQPHMQHQFAQVPEVQIQRSTFDRSHGYKTTFDSGYLIPVFVDEVLPGDTFSLEMTTFARLSTPLHPFMDNLWLDAFFFFVPNRLVWTHFVNFFGEQANPSDSTSFVVPTATSPTGGYVAGSLQDYFGLPTASATAGLGVNPANTYAHNNLPLRCYNKIYNDWFRDQNLQNSVQIDVGDGPDTYTNYSLLRRGKRHDYFTSALPWPQKGPAVGIPLGSQAPVVGIGGQSGTSVAAGSYIPVGQAGLPSGALSAAGANLSVFSKSAVGTANSTALNSTNAILYADLSAATAATINQLRQAFQIQKIYERDARGGTRYTELIQAHFGVVSPDARLQRSEYLGGGTSPVNVNPIAQTGPSGTTGSTTPQGNLTGVGTQSMKCGFTKSFTEHGYVIGLVSVRADMNYQQGLDRMWQRSTRFDFYWPALSHIGEQAITNDEIYCRGDQDPNDALVFGYQERYAEYRYKPSRITGQYRSGFATPLDSWHLAQSYSTLPTLGATFIVENPPVARVVAVPSQPQFLFDSHMRLICARPMPVYGVPGDIDRF